MLNEVVAMARRAHFYTPARFAYRVFWKAFDTLTNRSGRLFSGYREYSSVCKLHIGCGANYLDGWFNTDLTPNYRRARLDAVRPFPYPNEVFDYIYSEHMIEHIPHRGAVMMLSECFRILKRGGVLRIVTPDLHFLMELFSRPNESMHRDYIRWSSEVFIGDRAPHTAVSVVNNFVRDWGHQYIYDQEALISALQNSGFVRIKKCELGQSDHSELRCLEHQERMPNGFMALESMTFEASKQ